MMKKLFITDLDGTFFNSKAEVSNISSEIINKFILDGGYFTFATARSASSVVKMMKNVNINLPCILMNGVSIYDIQRKAYVKNQYFSEKSAVKIAEIFKECNVIPFMYKIEKNVLYTHYYDFQCKEMYDFFKYAIKTPERPFIKCNNLIDNADDNTIYFSVQGKEEDLSRAAKIIDKEEKISYAFYRDVYNKDIWFLEVFSEKASKSNGVRFIKEYCNFDYITCFGDNLNDLPMFNVCDRKIAVSNAKDEVKSAADEIIGDNDNDSVAYWIKFNLMNERK